MGDPLYVRFDPLCSYSGHICTSQEFVHSEIRQDIREDRCPGGFLDRINAVVLA
jgi:hypothetical protein